MLFRIYQLCLQLISAIKLFFSMKKNTKQVKLQSKYRALICGPEKIVPWLTISGLWLEENGFKAGDIVTITIEKNRLTIKNK